MFLLALRNILRSRRRTVVSGFLVLSGTFLLASFRFLANGLQQDMVSRAIHLDSGYAEVTAFGWKEKPGLERALEVTPQLLDSLRVPGVTALSPRIRSGALLNTGDHTRFVSVLAADPEAEKNITTIHTLFTAGGPPADRPGLRGAAIGQGMARSLGLKVGSRFFLVTSQMDGSVGALELAVSGVYHARQSHLDTGRVQITLDAGQELFGTRLEGPSESKPRRFYSSVALGIPDHVEARAVMQRLRSRLPSPKLEAGLRPEESQDFSPVALSYDDLNPDVREMVELGHLKMDIYLVFFVISISFGILNAIQMSIQERLREFGILLAIGTRPVALLRLIAYETALLVVPGVLVGMAGAVALSAYLHAHPVDLSGTTMGRMYETFGMVARFRPLLDFSEQWRIALGLILPALAAGLLAGRRLFRLNPTEVIGIL